MKIIAIASCLFLVLGVESSHAQTPDTLVAEGRAFLVAHDVANANARFASALALAPTHENANVFYAATRLLVLAEKPVGKALLDRFGVSATNRNLYAWTATFPTDKKHVPFAPTNTSGQELSAFLRTNVLQEIIGAAANLAAVNNPNFTLLLTENETGVAKVTLDRGDLLLMRAALQFAQYAIYTVNSWNLDAQLTALRTLFTGDQPTAEHLLRDFPNLFTFASINDLAAARQAFSDGVTLYATASNLIRSRPPGVVRLFNHDPEAAVAEAAFQGTLNELKQSLNGPVVLSVEPSLTVHFAQHFNGSRAPRTFLPQFQGNAIVAGTLPDLTFGGLVQGVTRHDAEELLGAEKHLKVPFVSKWTVPSRLPDGRFQLSLTGRDGTLLALQYSLDLQTWTTLDIVCVTNGFLPFVEDMSAGPGMRYYRALDLAGDIPPDFYPPQDNFASRGVLSGSAASAVSANFGATGEPDEPFHNAWVDGGSVWWTWTAPSNGLVVVDTSGTPFYVALAVYTGNSLATLSDVASDSGSGPDGSSYVEFFADAGVTYQIAVASDFIRGKVVLNLKQFPYNDAYEDRTEIIGTTNTVTGSTLNASKQPSEPDHAGDSGGHSLWWSWTAPTDGLVTIDTSGSSFDTLLAVYYDPAFGDFFLYDVASNDDSGLNVWSSVTFAAQAATTYQIAVDGFHGAAGNVQLRVRHVRASPPPNDRFANRSSIVGTNVSVTGSNLGASRELNEPNHNGEPGGRSVWWTWTAPLTGRITLDTVGSTFQPIIVVYTGNSLLSLSNVNLERYLEVAAGTTYQIAVDGISDDEFGNVGNITLNLHVLPPNDYFENSIEILGATNTATGSNLNATKEEGELRHAGNRGGGSVWWTWTAPRDGTVTLDTFGSSFDTLLEVYRGGEIWDLSSITNNDDFPGTSQSQLTFQAQAGVAYQIVVDGYDGAVGSIVLHLREVFAPPPANDDFQNRLLLTGTNVTASGANLGATREPGEPNHASASARSVWWSWTAPITGDVTVDTAGSNFDTVLAVYFGNSISNLLRVAEDDEGGGDGTSALTFSTTAGATYQIAVDGSSGASGNIVLHVHQAPAPISLPQILVQPSATFTFVGGSARFDVTATGTFPLGFQWKKQGSALPGANAATYTFANVQSNDAGSYSVTVSNLAGLVTSSNAQLSVFPGGESFRIVSLLTNNSRVVEHSGITGDDWGGIAASTSRILYSGEFSTARFGLADLSGGTSLGYRFDALVSDLRSGTVYSLGNGSTLISFGGTVATLLEHDGNTGLLNGSSIALSAPITVPYNGGHVGLFSGYGRIVLHTGLRIYDIRLPSGLVVDLGPATIPTHRSSGNWAYWGVAEFFGNTVSLVYARDFQTIVRTMVPAGPTTTLGSFLNLSDMAAFTISVGQGRWYFHYEGAGQFGGTFETIGYADAVFSFEP